MPNPAVAIDGSTKYLVSDVRIDITFSAIYQDFIRRVGRKIFGELAKSYAL